MIPTTSIGNETPTYANATGLNLNVEQPGVVFFAS